MITAEQLLTSHATDRCELIEGELRMMSPAGGEHGRIAMNIAFLLELANKQAKAGRVYAAETGFVIGRNPDTVRAPDVAFVEQSLVDKILDESKYLPFAPTVAVEVISPTDNFSEVAQKAQQWLSSGTRVVWLVDPKNKTIQELRSSSKWSTCRANEPVSLADIIPECQFLVSQVFE